MKKFLVIYGVLSVLFLGVVYLLTLFDVTQERMNHVYQSLASDAVESRRVETFLKFQSLGFKEIETYETEHYDIYVHQTLARRNDVYVNQLSVIVIPKTTVDYALFVDDEDDGTSIVLFDLNRNETRFDSLDHQIDYDYAVSYGIFLYGLYNYAIELSQDYTLRMTLFDYNENEIIQETFVFTYTPFDDIITMPMSYERGFSISEIDQLLNLNMYLRRSLRINLAIYLVCDILLGASIYAFIKQHKSKKANA